MSNVLSVTELRKDYGRTVAVDGVSFEVGRNEIVGLLGPNGAGKTTIINMILGVLAPSAGGIRIGGVELAAQRRQALARTNFAAVYAPLPGNLTVYQNLRVFGLLYGVTGLSKRIGVLLARFDLLRFRDTKCGLLSSGEQTRVSLVKALLNAPHLLRLGPPAEWFVWPIPALISPFAGVFYPLSTLPEGMQYVARVLPPAYVFEGLRTAISGGAVSGPALALGAGLAVLDILLACAFFAHVYRHAVRTGLIARYSAESVS